MKKIRGTIVMILLIALSLTGVQMPQKAKAVTAEVILWRPGEDNHLQHVALGVGNEYDDIQMKISGATARSVEWQMSNTSIASVQGNGNQAVVHGIREGVSTLTVRVITTGGAVLTDTALISVITPLSGETDGRCISSADIHMGAADSSFVRKTAPIGQSLVVLASCGDFYQVRLPETFVMSDDISHKRGFVRKNQIYIAVTGITLPEMIIKDERDGDFSVVPTLVPSGGNTPVFEYRSSNTKVIEVANDGRAHITGSGKAVIHVQVQGQPSISCDCCIKVRPFTAITGVTIRPENIVMNPGDTKQLVGNVLPMNGTEDRLNWTSSDSGIVEVDADGFCTARSYGTAIITVTDSSGQFSAQCSCSVKNISVQGIYLPESQVLSIGETRSIGGKVTPSNAANQTIYWLSSDPRIVTVDCRGNITAKTTGTVTIYGTTEDGGYKKQCRVVVRKGVEEILISDNKDIVQVGTKRKIGYQMKPTDATHKDIRWTSSENTVLSVDKQGNMVAKNPGTSVVTIYDRFSGVCDIQVYLVEPKKSRPKTVKMSIQRVKGKKKVKVKWAKLSYAISYEVAIKGKGAVKVRKNHCYLSSTVKGKVKVRAYYGKKYGYGKYSKEYKVGKH